MEIVIRHDLCKKCKICIEMCPKKVLDLDAEGYAYLADSGNCNKCGLCEWICPDYAVEIVNE